MKKILFSISAIVIAAFALNVHVSLFGNIAQASALSFEPTRFETSLSAPIGSTDTAMNLVSGLNNDGIALSGYQCFTIDSNQPNVEDVCGTANGASITAMARGISGSNGTTTVAALRFSHRRGADVKVTDEPFLVIFSRIMNTVDGFPNLIQYDQSVSTSSITSNRSNLVDFGLLQDTAFNVGSINNAGVSTKGVVQIATGLQTASSTATGSTGATLVIPASEATSTYNASTAALVVPVTKNNGHLDSNFIYPVATTWPATNGASSTVLANDGSGNLSWVNQSILLYQNMGIGTSTSQTATNTALTIPIPANTLTKTNGVLRLTVYAVASGPSGNCGFGVNFGSGSATTSVAYINGSVAAPVRLFTEINAATSTTPGESVYSSSYGPAQVGFGSVTGTTGDFNTVFDMTAKTYLGVTWFANANFCFLNGAQLELVKL